MKLVQMVKLDTKAASTVSTSDLHIFEEGVADQRIRHNIHIIWQHMGRYGTEMMGGNGTVAEVYCTVSCCNWSQKYSILDRGTHLRRANAYSITTSA